MFLDPFIRKLEWQITGEIDQAPSEQSNTYFLYTLKVPVTLLTPTTLRLHLFWRKIIFLYVSIFLYLFFQWLENNFPKGENLPFREWKQFTLSPLLLTSLSSLLSSFLSPLLPFFIFSLSCPIIKQTKENTFQNHVFSFWILFSLKIAFP